LLVLERGIGIPISVPGAILPSTRCKHKPPELFDKGQLLKEWFVYVGKVMGIRTSVKEEII
jgi:hypothetical protein